MTRWVPFEPRYVAEIKPGIAQSLFDPYIPDLDVWPAIVARGGESGIGGRRGTRHKRRKHAIAKHVGRHRIGAGWLVQVGRRDIGEAERPLAHYVLRVLHGRLVEIIIDPITGTDRRVRCNPVGQAEARRPVFPVRLESNRPEPS